MNARMSREECKDLLKGLLLVITLITTGLGFGYWYRGQELNLAHVQELERIQRNYELSLEFLTGKVNRTAEKLEDAAATAATAAETANKAASNVKRPAPAPTPTPAPSSKADVNAINLEIEKANRSLGGTSE